MIGLLAVLLLPLTFIPLLGYAVAATREAAAHPESGPPSWRFSGRMLADGFLVAAALLLLAAPFVLLSIPLSRALTSPGLWHASGAIVAVYGRVTATFVVALPLGLLLLLVMPHATARFASTGDPRRLFDFPGAVRRVRRDFPTWNVVVAAMVTAWAIGLACLGLLCVGAAAGVFYAILVSAHAAAALKVEDQDQPAR